MHQHLGRLQADSPTDTLEIIDRYALGPGVDDVSAIIVARRLSIADTPWWRVDMRTGQFYHSDAAGSGSTQKDRWTTGRHDAQSFETTHGTDLWNPTAWRRSSLWYLFMTKSQTLGPGECRPLAREHVFIFQYKCPVNGPPRDPNLCLINHGSRVLIQKRIFQRDIRRHYTGHDTFKLMASVETMKELHEVC